MKPFYIVRHGHSLANEKQLIVSSVATGIEAFGLTKKGIQQAKNTSTTLKVMSKNFHICSSKFLRAVETAKILQETLGCSVSYHHELAERYFGDLEAQSSVRYQDVWDLDKFDPSHKSFGVESNEEVAQRLDLFFKKIETISVQTDVIIVSHGDTIKIIQCLLMKLPLNLCLDVAYLNNAELKVLSKREAPVIAAHRGNSSQFLENTMPAFESAIEHSIPYIEMDIQHSKDNVPMILHDPNLKRTFNADVSVKDYCFKQIKELSQNQVPSLQEVLSKIPTHIQCLIEMKDGWTNSLEQNLVAQLDQTLLMDFDHSQLILAQKAISSLRCIWLLDQLKDVNEIISIALKNNFFAVSFDYKIILGTPELVFEAKQAGLAVYCWTVNNFEDALQLIELGVDLITTDYPISFKQKLTRSLPKEKD
ncbi:MAG: histidine phosphatase family protein [Lentisphaeria bacterium]|nr:histidine phosphatase family protein [Lentisphaeria bacterium]